MADINTLSRLVNGFQRNVDVSQNSLVVGSLKVGVSSPTELTKAILDKLVLIHNAADADGTFDTRYVQPGTLAATGGAALIGIQDTGGYYSGSTVEAALQELGTLVGSGTAEDITFDNSTSGLAAANVQDAIDELDGIVDAISSDYIPQAEKAAPNGVATLDGGGKIPASQLPNSVMDYKGNWDADANTPTLADGVGSAGDVYRSTSAGTVDFGSGNITFAIGDWAVYNGTIWEKSNNSNSVVSVNGLTGIVVLDTDDIAEGATNKYFSDALAQAATISQVITDGVTTKAPSEDAVFEALALKQDASAELDEAVTFFGATDISGAEAEQLTDSSNADSLHSHAALKESLNAGEAFAATTLFAVRFAKAADSGFVAGRLYKADIDATSTDNFHVIGLVRAPGSVTAGNPILATKAGLITATSHGFTVGLPLFLSSSGALTQTAPTTANMAVVKVGMVRDANTIEVQIQIIGVN